MVARLGTRLPASIVVVSPSPGIVIDMYTSQTRRNESGTFGADIKKGTFVYQPLASVDAPKVMDLVQLLDG